MWFLQCFVPLQSRRCIIHRALLHYCTICVFKSQKVPYEWSPLSIFAPEGHLDSVLVPRPLVKGLARLERGAVEMQTGCALCVAGILHTVQANGVLNSRSQKKEERGKKECNQHVPQECYKMLRKHYNQPLPLEMGSCIFISAMWQLTWFYIGEDLGLKKTSLLPLAHRQSPLWVTSVTMTWSQFVRGISM